MHKLTSMYFHGSTATSHKNILVSFERCAGFYLTRSHRKADKLANKGRKNGMSECRLEDESTR